MELQLALDVVTAKQGMEAAAAVADLIGVLELGTPFVLANPLEIIGEFKRALPGVKILADYKIMDGGAILAGMAVDAGAVSNRLTGIKYAFEKCLFIFNSS